MKKIILLFISLLPLFPVVSSAKLKDNYEWGTTNDLLYPYSYYFNLEEFDEYFLIVGTSFLKDTMDDDTAGPFISIKLDKNTGKIISTHTYKHFCEDSVIFDEYILAQCENGDYAFNHEMEVVKKLSFNPNANNGYNVLNKEVFKESTDRYYLLNDLIIDKKSLELVDEVEIIKDNKKYSEYQNLKQQGNNDEAELKKYEILSEELSGTGISILYKLASRDNDFFDNFYGGGVSNGYLFTHNLNEIESEKKGKIVLEVEIYDKNADKVASIPASSKAIDISQIVVNNEHIYSYNTIIDSNIENDKCENCKAHYELSVYDFSGNIIKTEVIKEITSDYYELDNAPMYFFGKQVIGVLETTDGFILSTYQGGFLEDTYTAEDLETTDFPAFYKYYYTYDINVKNDNNGKVEVQPSSRIGKTVDIVLKPNDGYELKSLTVNDSKGNEVEIKENKFTMPSADVIVEASFVPKKVEQEKEEVKEEKNPETSDFVVLIIIIILISGIYLLSDYVKKANYQP